MEVDADDYKKESHFIKSLSNNSDNAIKGLIVSVRPEEDEGFEEVSNSTIKFFNLGPNNDWKNILSKNLIDSIEKNFNKEMKALGYI